MKTAWFLMHRIRMAMDGSSGTGLMGGPGKIVEADETFITARPRPVVRKMRRLARTGRL
jgi:hypothetical protein